MAVTISSGLGIRFARFLAPMGSGISVDSIAPITPNNCLVEECLPEISPQPAVRAAAGGYDMGFINPLAPDTPAAPLRTLRRIDLRQNPLGTADFRGRESCILR